MALLLSIWQKQGHGCLLYPELAVFCIPSNFLSVHACSNTSVCEDEERSDSMIMKKWLW